jgi:extradiol dioxygenase family protein
MRSIQDAFHVAVPVRDLDEAVDFYAGGLDARPARRYPDRVTFDFFGDQLVCHLSGAESIPEQAVAYPRHFGVTFADPEDFDRVVSLVRHKGLRVIAEPSVRFPGTPEQHRTMFLADPSNNVIEFKNYDDPRLQY